MVADRGVDGRELLEISHSPEPKHRPLSRPGPDVIAKWERIALAQATTAIGAGDAAGVLHGTGDPAGRAKAWTELGDVPLDVAERLLPGSAPPLAARAP